MEFEENQEMPVLDNEFVTESEQRISCENCERPKGRVSIRGVKSLWVDSRFIPADQGSYWVICAICSF